MYFDAGTGIIKRECTGTKCQTPVVIYKRKALILENSGVLIDVYTLMIDTWHDDHNVLGQHFDLYSSLEDALEEKNAWTYCNYNDPGVAFPRDCGPTGGLEWNFNSLSGGSAWTSNSGFEWVQNYQFSVYQDVTTSNG